MFFLPVLKYASSASFDNSIQALRSGLGKIVRTRLAGEQKESQTKDLLGALIGQIKKYQSTQSSGIDLL
jgi:hypothetical protein